MMESMKKTAGDIQGIILIISTFLPIMGIVALMPALPTLMRHFDYIENKDYIIPMLLTAPSLCIAFIAPVAGFLSDKFGRRRLLLLAMLLYGFGGIFPFFLDNFYFIVAGRFCLGISEAFIMTISYALFADYFDEEKRKKWIAAQGWVTAILGTLLILASGYLASIGWQWPFIVYGIAFPVLVLSWIFIYEPRKAAGATEAKTGSYGDFKQALPVILTVSLVTLVTSILYFTYTIHYSLVLEENGISDQTKIGWTTAFASAFVPIGSYYYRRVASLSIYRQLAIVFVLLGLGLVGVGSVDQFNWNVFLACIQQIGCGLTIPVLSGWALYKLPVDQRGIGMGFWTCSLFLGQFICPILIASAKSILGNISQSFVLCGVICLLTAITIILYMLVFNKNKKYLI